MLTLFHLTANTPAKDTTGALKAVVVPVSASVVTALHHGNCLPWRCSGDNVVNAFAVASTRPKTRSQPQPGTNPVEVQKLTLQARAATLSRPRLLSAGHFQTRVPRPFAYDPQPRNSGARAFWEPCSALDWHVYA